MPFFSAPFPIALSGSVSPTATSFPYVDDHVAVALSRLLQQYKGLPLIEALLAIYIEQLQEVEAAYFEILVAFDLNGATGVSLDAVGAEVGQLRSGMNDTQYRIAIKARIIANWSTGTEAELSSIMRELLGITITMSWQDVDEATAIIDLQTQPPFAFDPDYIMTNFLQRAKTAGVRLFLIYLNAPIINTFTCAPADASVIDPLLGAADDTRTSGGWLSQVIGG